MNKYIVVSILSCFVAYSSHAENIRISLKRFDCYGNLIRVVFQKDQKTIDFYKFPEHLGFNKCEDALKFAANYTDAQGNLEGNFTKKVSVVNETRCFGGQYGACTELPVMLEELQFQFKSSFFGNFDWPQDRAYYKYISGCSDWSKYMRCN